MDTKITARVAPPDPGRPPAPAPAPAVEAPAPSRDLTAQRLVIEKDQASGSYVYKTINRDTGEVVQQLPRAELLKMRDAAHYAAGSIVRTKV